MKYASDNLKFSHLLFWNLTSSKNIYKKYIELSELKSLIIDLMKKWNINAAKLKKELNDDKNINFIDYEPIFNKYSSFEEFVDKNLIILNIRDMKCFLSDGNIDWKEIALNNKKSNRDYNENQASEVNLLYDSLTKGINSEGNWKKYSATLNFINDLINISEILKCALPEKRNKILSNFIEYINVKLLPTDIYIPTAFGEENINLNNYCNDTNLQQQIVLKISEEYSFCLSTKDKVPFHILIEVAELTENGTFYYQPSEEIEKKYDYNCNDTYNSFMESQDKFFTSNRKEVGYKPTHTITDAEPSNPGFFSSLLCCFDPNRYIENEKSENEEFDKIGKTNKHGLYGSKKFVDVSNSILKKSIYKHKFSNRKIISLIVKGGEDMRQDQFVSQLIEIFMNVFDKENLDIFLKPLNIITTGRGGIVETITNTTSLVEVKSLDYSSFDSNKNNNSMKIKNNKSNYGYLSYFLKNKSDPNEINMEESLKNFFVMKFGEPSYNNEKYKRGIRNFMKSLVGYSLLCYFLEIKDRNNGNILIDDDGHLIHIDFGFLLSHSPGNVNFEKAPFKLTTEYVDLLDGVDSILFAEFQELFYQGFLALRKNYILILNFIEIFTLTNSDLPCFYNKELVLASLRKKFMVPLVTNSTNTNEEEVIKTCTDALIFYSLDHWRTMLYDNFQNYCVGVKN